MMKRIFLIGYMGAGKTTVGKALAKRMNLSFVDLDTHLEARYHKTIARLFEEKTENGFREIERRMLHEVALFEDVLISTGGGAPCFFDNMAFMNAVGQTVYLKVSPGELAKRLALPKHTRPVLNGRCGEELYNFVSQSLEQRSVYYMQASIVFDAEVMCTENDVQNVADALEKILYR
jgi:shikimate kinase